MRLTRELSDDTSEIVEYSNPYDEMLSLLPPYRWPAKDEFTEYMIFYDPDCMICNGKGYEQPDFIAKLEKEAIDDDIISNIKEYVRDSELRIIALAQCKDELGELKEMISDAQQIYQENRHERPYKRNALVVKEIGLSTGHPQKRINKKSAYSDYVTFVRKEGMSRKEAVELIKKNMISIPMMPP